MAVVLSMMADGWKASGHNTDAVKYCLLGLSGYVISVVKYGCLEKSGHGHRVTIKTRIGPNNFFCFSTAHIFLLRPLLGRWEDKMTSVAMAFDRPVGIHRDIAELEFITALLQTPKTFLRNRVTAEDLVVYLRSRHGVSITEDSVRQLLVQDLAGSTVDNQDHDSIDPCQLVAIFLIPQLLRAFDGGDVEKSRVFDSFSAEIAAFKKDKELTVEGLHKIVSSVGENNFSDSLLHEMVTVLKTNNGSIAKTLTSDLTAFDIGWETKATTNFVDAMHSKATEGVAEQSQPQGNELSVVSTASFIDFTADTVRRPVFHALLLGCGIATYFAYVLNVENEWVTCTADDSSNENDSLCQIGKGLVSWLYLFLQLVLLGLPLIVLGSFGNSIKSSTPLVYVLRLLVAIATIGTYTIVPYFKVRSSLSAHSRLLLDCITSIDM